MKSGSIVTRPELLSSVIQEISGSGSIGLDTESNSFYRYPEQLCLVQVATTAGVYVLDVISLPDISPLGPVLSDASIVKVIHGADYDVRSLDRHCGFRVRNLFDTSIAARFVGVTKFGLGDLLKVLLGVTIEKSKRLQLTDWGRRPLPEEALDYAVADVSHLLALHRVLSGRLKDLGRTEWVAEECARLEAARYSEPDRETAFLSVKGAGDLDERGLAVLRSLVAFRENEALRQHRPPFFIIPDVLLVSLARDAADGLGGLPSPNQAEFQRYRRAIVAALREGMVAPPVSRPQVAFERPGRDQLERLKRLKAWRTSQAAELSLDPSLIWPAVSLERLAKDPSTFDVEVSSADVRRWQRERFGDSIRSVVTPRTRPRHWH